ncbi:FG-GAP-like repeat-containing protein [Paenibacillus oenotherae]|uniref:FG-GAP-like repeat-containing protein n=1 Tax=Paenibacillus oenotherae TaxID=1435645 RepID=A0ABS7D763_9BACL|nr:toxin TcdB middle/N-terminal domain-containing protein [Paenibacillus oenotherae]MBW7475377.1 FG-GAP-like repeat-containing protein [Paenibacillus oenotherae]
MSATTGTAEQILSLPKGGGAVNGLGETFQTDFHTGTGSYSIPLDIPNGPGDIAPKLALHYQTTGGQGPFGFGFGLSQLAVKRSTDKRIPTFTEADPLILAGGGELAETGDGTYRLNPDTNGWIIAREGEGFRIMDNAGKYYRLGTTGNGRQTLHIGGSEEVYSWVIQEIEDSLGFKVRYSYLHDGNVLYPERIDYSIYSVLFYYEERPDLWVSRRAGFVESHSLRCTHIELHVNGEQNPVARRWELMYAPAEETGGHSFLKRVKLTGYNNAGESASVPVLTLSYSSFQPRTLERIGAESPDARPGALQQGTRELIDWDGNGLPDLLEIGGGTARVWKNKGDLTWGRPRSIGPLPAAVSLSEPGTAFADMEGNGTADLIMLDRPLAGYYPHKAKGGFERPVFWRRTPNVRLSDPNVRLVDLNGDGIADLLVTGEDYFSLYYREKDGEWAERPVLIPRSEAPPVFLKDSRVHLADMTGDGLQDLVRVDGSGVVYWPYLGLGRWDDPVVVANPPELGRLYDPRRMFLTDVDGDGCADLVYVGTDRVTYWLNVNGHRLADPQEIRFAPSAPPEQIRLADMNGSGTAGVLWSINRPGARATDYYYLDFAGSVKPYLLNRIDNGMGLVTEIEYGSSTSQALRDESIGEAWPTFLPFPIPVILSLRTQDGASDSPGLTRFRYHDGHYDGISREFCGFGRVEIEEYGDESIPTMLTRNRYHLGLHPDEPDRPLAEQERTRLKALRGKLLATEVFGADGSDKENMAYMRTSSSWEVHVVPPPDGSVNVKERVSPRLLESRTAYYEREAEPYRITVNLNKAFDDAGNATIQEQRVEDPRNGALNRTLITETSYAIDPASRFRGKPSRTIQRDGSGGIVSATISYYDDLPESGIGAAGLLTRQETLVLSDELTAEVYGGELPDFAALGYHRRAGENGWWINQVSYTRTEDGGVLRGTTTNARGNTTRLEFDAHRIQPIRVTDALGNMTEAELDYRTNKVSKLTDASGVAIMNRYDPLGRLLAAIEPGASDQFPTIRYEYPAAGSEQHPACLLTAQRLENGKAETLVSKTFISGSGQTIEERSVAGGQEIVETSQQYSARGLIKKQFLPFQSPEPAYTNPAALGIASRQFRYDAIGRLIEALGADGTLQKQAFEPGIAYMYDEEDTNSEAGARHASTPTRHTFDPAGRIMEAAVNDAGNWLSTFYEYDIKGNLLSVIDSAGAQSTFRYDCLGRRLLTDNPVSGESLFVFDAGGNQVEKRDAAGKKVRFEFDALDRLFRTTLPGSGAQTAQFTYDDAGAATPPEGDGNSKGKIVKITHQGGSEVLAYDELGRVKHRELSPDGLGGQKFAFDYTYRATGQIESITYPKPAAAAGRLVVRYSYDQRGRLSAIPGFVKKISYNTAGLRDRIEYASGVATAYVYDALSLRLTGLHTVDGTGAVLQQFDYRHDRVGNLLGVDSPDPKLAASYEYDNLYRLVEASTISGQLWSYNYDNGGNLTHKSDVGAYVYDAEGRLATAGPHAFSYTATGQTRTGPWGEASYDAIGRMTAVTRGNEEMACTYNHAGSRVRMQITGGAEELDQWTLDDLLTIQNGTAIGYIMDGAVRVAQLALAAGTASFLHGDHLGSTTLVTAMDGTVLQRVYYDPFGAVLDNTVEAGAEGTSHLYTGALYDHWSELLYCQARYYDPQIGRFLMPDTMVPELYHPMAWNRYSYVQNNPLRYIDPTGHFWEEIGQWFEDNWKQIVAAVAVVAVIVLAVVLSVVTFGVAGIIAVGIGMAIGGVVGGISASAAGGDVLLGVLCGMAVGGAAALGGMGIGAGMAAAFGAKTLAATLLTGALAGAVNGAAMGFTAGFAGGQGSIGDIWEKMLEGALVGAITGAIMGFGSYLFGGGTLGTGKLSIPKPSTAALGKAAVGFAAGSLAELGREAAAGKGLDPLKILGAGAGGAGLGAFVSFGGSSGLPVLDFLKPALTGAVSSLFAQGVSAVFVLDYADDLWKFILQNDLAKVSKSGKFNYP